MNFYYPKRYRLATN